MVAEIGEESALSGVYVLSDLSMSDWPFNTTAKVLKKDLADAIVKLQKG